MTDDAKAAKDLVQSPKGGRKGYAESAEKPAVSDRPAVGRGYGPAGTRGSRG